ncbi:MAG: glycosyltransferase family A protein [Pseudomonadota bacterium]
MISIVMPNYNKGAYIAAAVRSIVSQSCTDWELLLVDDGSTDDSLAVVAELAADEPRISLIHRRRDPKGGSTCRNIGLERATGSYVLFMDSDDLLRPGALAARMHTMEENPNADFVVFPMGTFVGEIGDSEECWLPPDTDHLQRFLSHDTPWHTMQPLWRTAFLRGFGGYNERYSRLQDIEFHSRALFHGDVCYAIAESNTPDCYFRLDPGRRASGHAQMLSQMIASTGRYLHDMDSLIEQSGSRVRPLRKALSGTPFEVVKKLMHYERGGMISADDRQQLAAQLMTEVLANSGFHRRMMSIYMHLYKAGASGVTGFHFMFKRLFSVLPVSV